MGVPYSKQINAAFDEVTPFVAAGFEVLETTKNIAILLAVIQISTAILLSLILIALLGLLFSINPELEKERHELVTPFMQWLAGWIFKYGAIATWFLKILMVLTTAGLGVSLWQGSIAGTSAPASVNGEVESEEDSEQK